MVLFTSRPEHPQQWQATLKWGAGGGNCPVGRYGFHVRANSQIKKMVLFISRAGTLRRPSFWICVCVFLLIQLSRVCRLETFPFSLHYLFRVIRCSKERSITRRRSKAHNADVVVDMSVVKMVCFIFVGLNRIGLPHETLLKWKREGGQINLLWDHVAL